MAAEAGTDYSGVLCGRATWKDGIPVYAKHGLKALEEWLQREGVRNINAVNARLQSACPWYTKLGISVYGADYSLRSSAGARPIMAMPQRNRTSISVPSSFTRMSPFLNSRKTRIPHSAASTGEPWASTKRSIELPCIASGTLVATSAASSAGEPNEAGCQARQMLSHAAVEVLAEFHRLAFHRQIHEEDLVDEGGEEDSEGEDEAGRVRSQAQIALPRFIQQRDEAADQNAGCQGEDDPFQRVRTTRALGASGACQFFMLARRP